MSKLHCHICRGKWGNAELRGKPKFSTVAKRLGGAVLWWHFCEVSVQVIQQYKRRARTVVNEVAATTEVFRGMSINAYPDQGWRNYFGGGGD